MRKLLIKETKSSRKRVAVRTQKWLYKLNSSIASSISTQPPILLMEHLPNSGFRERGPGPGFLNSDHSHSSVAIWVRPCEEYSTGGIRAEVCVSEKDMPPLSFLNQPLPTLIFQGVLERHMAKIGRPRLYSLQNSGVTKPSHLPSINYQ